MADQVAVDAEGTGIEGIFLLDTELRRGMESRSIACCLRFDIDIQHGVYISGPKVFAKCAVRRK